MTALVAGAEISPPRTTLSRLPPRRRISRQCAKSLEAAGFEFISAEIDMIPKNAVDVAEGADAESVSKLIDYLEDNDDVQNVYHNANLPEEEEVD